MIRFYPTPTAGQACCDGERPRAKPLGGSGQRYTHSSPRRRRTQAPRRLGGWGQVDLSIAPASGQRAPTYPHARRVGFSELLCDHHIPARLGTASPCRCRLRPPRLRLRRVRPHPPPRRPGHTHLRRRACAATPVVSLKGFASGQARVHSTRGLRSNCLPWAIQRRRASISGDVSSITRRTEVDRFDDCRQGPMQEKRRAAGCGARSSVHLGQGTEPRVLLGRPAPHNGLELSCPAEAGRPPRLYGREAGDSSPS